MKKIVRILPIIFIFLIISTCLLGLLYSDRSYGKEPYDFPAIFATDIDIDGNGQLAAAASSGNGSVGNPFILEIISSIQPSIWESKLEILMLFSSSEIVPLEMESASVFI